VQSKGPAPTPLSAADDDDLDDDAMTHVVASPADMPTNRPPGLRPRDSATEAAAWAPAGAQPAQNAMANSGGFPPPAFDTPLPEAPVVIAPPEPTKVRTPPPPAPIPSYPPPPVLDGTTKALIALIVVLSIGLTIVLFLLWRRS
jgi:hypothetical protein